MKITYRNIGVAIVSVGLVLSTGCVNQDGTQNNTGTGALFGGAIGAFAGAAGGGRHTSEHVLVGAAAGAITGGLIGHMIDPDQQRRLQQQSPQTLETIQHNDKVYQQQQATPSSQTQTQSAQTPPQTTETTFTPLTVDDIKALASAGVKPEAITKEIDISHSQYSPQDIAAAQQANVDSSVIECMGRHPS